MRHRTILAVLACALLAAPASAATESESHVKKSWLWFAGGGYGVPAGVTADNLEGQMSLQFGAQYRHDGWPVGVGFELGYDDFGVRNDVLDRLGVSRGQATVWDVTANAIWEPRTDSRVRWYFTAGAGAYRRRTELSRPVASVVNACDLFFGFCFPVEVDVMQIVGSDTQTRPGVNGGGGLLFPLKHRGEIYLEARYHRIFTPEATEFIPITIGVRW